MNLFLILFRESLDSKFLGLFTTWQPLENLQGIFSYLVHDSLPKCKRIKPIFKCRLRSKLIKTFIYKAMNADFNARQEWCGGQCLNMKKCDEVSIFVISEFWVKLTFSDISKYIIYLLFQGWIFIFYRNLKDISLSS